jgi:peptide/nickel transport system permease protein
MIYYLLRRVGLVATSVGALTVLVFLATNLLPGNPAIAILGKEATPEKVLVIQEALGLDEQVVTRYVNWIGNVLQLDFGRSVTQGLDAFSNQGLLGTPVSELIISPLKNSVILASVSLTLLIILTLLIGTYTALRAGSKIDKSIQIVGLLFISLPEFVLGAILIVLFCFTIPILPAVSFTVSPINLILPVTTLLLSMIGVTMRLVRVGVIDVLKTNFVITARLRGIPERTIIRKYLLPSALAPTLQIFAIAAGLFVGGMVVVEYLFGYPGIGSGFVSAVAGRDYPLVQAYAIILGGTYVIANFVVDIITFFTNPKLRSLRLS